MNNLVNILTNETQSLKVQLLEMTEKWAVTSFDEHMAYITDYREKTSARSRYKPYPGEFNRYHKLPGYIIRKEFDTHREKEIKKANLHYEDSILKLAERITKLGISLDFDKLEAKTSHIAENIETVLTDGKTTIRAYTIIAEGYIQRPHYRYLVKIS